MPDPFISRQDLTDLLGRDVTSDPGAMIAVDAACDMVRTLAECQFTAGTSTTAFDGTGTDALLLRELPVTMAGTVLVDGVAVTDYMLTTNGILLRGTPGGGARSVWPTGRQNITVTYEHGYTPADLPRDVRMVALAIATRLAVQGPALEENIGAVRVKYGTNSTDITDNEKRILRKYKPTRTSR